MGRQPRPEEPPVLCVTGVCRGGMEQDGSVDAAGANLASPLQAPVPARLPAASWDVQSEARPADPELPGLWQGPGQRLSEQR